MRCGEAGFTLVEILVALAIFGVVIVGGLGVVGSTGTGGFPEGLRTGSVTGRLAKDITAASVYLQAFQEFVADKGSSAATDGLYCIGSGCSPEVALPVGFAGYPSPSNQRYQLDWTKLEVRIQTWHWDDVADVDGRKYCKVGTIDCDATSSTESVKWVQTILTWQLKGVERKITVERFVP